MAARWVDHSFVPHMHDFYAVSLNYDGRGAFDCRDGAHDAAPGTSSLIAPGEWHTGHATSPDGWGYRNLHIDPALMATLLQGVEWRGALDLTFKSPLVRDAILATRLQRTFAGLAASDSLLQIESLLLSVVARLAAAHVAVRRRVTRARQESASVRRVKEWLDAYPRQNVSVNFLAGLAGLSPYHLVRVFHRRYGVPPHKYQTIVRTHLARRLLISGEAISDVAYETGFCDQSHLNRCFKRILGVTPGRYADCASPLRCGQSTPPPATTERATSRTTSSKASTFSRRSR